MLSARFILFFHSMLMYLCIYFGCYTIYSRNCSVVEMRENCVSLNLWLKLKHLSIRYCTHSNSICQVTGGYLRSNHNLTNESFSINKNITITMNLLHTVATKLLTSLLLLSFSFFIADKSRSFYLLFRFLFTKVNSLYWINEKIVFNFDMFTKCFGL